VVCIAEKRALYEFIVRHFLASCSKDAVGQETNVTIDIGGEAFRTTGGQQCWTGLGCLLVLNTLQAARRCVRAPRCVSVFSLCDDVPAILLLLPVAAGLMVTERNWLLVFTYTTWGGNANLPHFVEGMQFAPTEVRGGRKRACVLLGAGAHGTGHNTAAGFTQSRQRLHCAVLFCCRAGVAA
jgi:DNA topoisomerase-3